MNATEFVVPSTEDEAQEMMKDVNRYRGMLRDARERVEVLQTIIDTLNNRLDEYYANIGKRNERI